MVRGRIKRAARAKVAPANARAASEWLIPGRGSQPFRFTDRRTPAPPPAAGERFLIWIFCALQTRFITLPSPRHVAEGEVETGNLVGDCLPIDSTWQMRLHPLLEA